MTEPSLLQRVVRERVPDMMASPSGIWRGSCPRCAHDLCGKPTLEVFADFFRCSRCGVAGNAVAFIMNDDGLTYDEAADVIDRMGRQ
jgi:hypothetical protein